MPFGRTEEEWEELVSACTVWLVEVAGSQQTTTYKRTNSKLAPESGQTPFNFAQPRDRAAMGSLLGDVTRATLADAGAMLSALVLYEGANDAGPGFYKLAVELGLLAPRPTAADRDTFWAGQVAAIHERYR